MSLPSRPFDLSLLDFESRRHAKRHKLFKWSLPLVGVLVLVSVWLVLPTTLTAVATARYNDRQYSGATSTLSGLTLSNVIEPYIALYNQGTALSAAGNYDQAKEKLETALAYTSDTEAVCRISMNLVSTLESAGDTSFKQANFSGAVTYYTQALARWTDSKTCFDGSTVRDRIQIKLDAAKKAVTQKSSSKSDTKSTDQPTQSQQDKLKQNEQKAQQTRNESQQGNNSSYNDDYTIKPW